MVLPAGVRVETLEIKGALGSMLGSPPFREKAISGFFQAAWMKGCPLRVLPLTVPETVFQDGPRVASFADSALFATESL